MQQRLGIGSPLRGSPPAPTPATPWEVTMASQYGALERRIARLLSDFPRLKSCIKLSYARAAYLLSGGRAAKTATQRPLSRIGSNDYETFFGYYDKSPLSADGWVLCHASYHPSNRPPRA